MERMIGGILGMDSSQRRVRYSMKARYVRLIICDLFAIARLSFQERISSALMRRERRTCRPSDRRSVQWLFSYSAKTICVASTTTRPLFTCINF